jgi:single-strand DNA-binding protein
MNNVSLIGRLVKDFDIYRTGKGKDASVVGKVTIAVDNPYKKDEDGNNTADFIRITVFGSTADFAEKYLKKGTRIGLLGRIQTGSYEDEDGNTVYTTEVVAHNLFFADAKQDDSSNSNNSSKQKGSHKSKK